MTRVGGIDVGGTTVKVGVLTDGDYASAGTPRPTPRGAGAIVELVADLVAELRADGDLDAVGVGVPGVVDDDAGIGVWSANLGWRDVPFRDLLTTRLGLPVAFGHDVRLGGLAEMRRGAGRGHDDQVFLPIGTGIAAAVMIGGRPHAAAGWAGEIGHVDVGHLEVCVCGLTGCLEAIASGGAIRRRYESLAGHRTAGAVEVAAHVRAGDPVAVRVWNEALDGLATALAWSASVLAPEIVVLGGGVALAGEDLLDDPLRARIDQRLSFQRRPALVRAALGDRAGSLGAGLAALDLIGAAA